SALSSLLLNEFLWLLGIAEFVGVEIYDENANTVFHSAFAEFAQIRTPPRVLLQIVGHTFGEKDVPCIATIHHSLRHVDPSAGNVWPIIDVPDSVDRSTVNPHSYFQFRVVKQCFADLERTSHRNLHGVEKDEGNAVAPG